MARHMLNIKGYVLADESTAEFTILWQADDEDNRPIATIGTTRVDPESDLQLMLNAFRMGTKCGKESS